MTISFFYEEIKKIGSCLILLSAIISFLFLAFLDLSVKPGLDVNSMNEKTNQITTHESAYHKRH
jgi:hypothetical protein